ncbi:MAG: transcriptional repressor [Prevotella sp.]|nr:transcriptional repressor [Prevotella sp.]
MENILNRLKLKGVKPTANRILVLKELLRSSAPASLSDLEKRLPNMDKSSIFRVLTLFLEHDVVHAFQDGRGTLSYELCESTGVCTHNDHHVHFYCEKCQQTFCFHHISLSQFNLPQGFEATSASFVIKGICAKCKQS